MHEHAAHLGGMVRPAHPALDAHVGAPCRAGAGQHGRQVAGTEAHQRVLGVQHGDDHLTHLAIGHRVAGAGAHDFDDHAFIDHETRARCGLVGDQADVGGGIGLVGLDAALAQPVAQRRRKGLAADQRLAQRPHVRAGLGRLFQQDAQEAGRAAVGVRTQVGHRLQLHLRVAHTTRKDRAAQRLRARLHHPGAWCEVVTETVVHQVAVFEAGGRQRPGDAPVVRRRALGLVDRPGRLVDAPRAFQAPQPAPADGGKAAEGVGGPLRLLALQQLGLARHGQAGQGLACGDGIRVHTGQRLGHGRRLACRGDEAGQAGHQGGLALGGLPGFQRIARAVHAARRAGGAGAAGGVGRNRFSHRGRSTRQASFSGGP